LLHFLARERLDVDVSDERNVEAVLFHVKQYFMKFSCIVPQLCDDKLRAGFDLFSQFDVLHNLLGFCCLEGRDNCPGKKIGGLVTDRAFHGRIFKPAVHADINCRT
jgi:hypothetical protein